jgi:hypothetical protein
MGHAVNLAKKLYLPSGVSAALPSPLAYYKFNDGSGTVALDSSGNGFNGTLVNAPLWVPGKFGTGLQFNGTTNYVSVTSPALQIVGEVTYACWFNAAGLIGESDIIDHGNFGYTFWYSAANAGISFIQQSATVAAFAPFPTANAWHHLVGTYRAGNFSIYLDGLLSATYALVPAISYAGSPPLTIGAGIAPNSDGFFNGIIDEVRIYNVALSRAQVAKLFKLVPSP